MGFLHQCSRFSPSPLQNTCGIFDHLLVSTCFNSRRLYWLPKSTACCLYSSLCLSYCEVKQETSLQDQRHHSVFWLQLANPGSPAVPAESSAEESSLQQRRGACRLDQLASTSLRPMSPFPPSVITISIYLSIYLNVYIYTI